MKKFLAAFLAASLVACSGGGGSKSTPCTTDCPVTASNLIVSLSKQELLDVSTDSVTVTVTAVDSTNNAVAGAVVQVVPQGALYSAISNTTDSSGKATGTVTISDDKTDHDVILTVTSGSISKQIPLAVKGSRLSATVKDVVLSPGGTTTVTYTLVDANSAPISNAAIAVSQSEGTVGQTGDTVTDINGHYVYTFNAPTSSGEVVVTGSAGKVSVSSSITVNTATTVPPVETTVASANLALSPSNIGTNTANSTLNQVEVSASFVDLTGAPIPNIRVRFDLPGDGASVVGGTVTSAGGIVYTDTNGVAQTRYIPGTRASGAGGLTIRACWDYADFAAVGATATCPSGHTLLQVLTINDLPLSIFPTSSFKLTPNDDTSVYTMPIVVQVTDSAGHPKAGVKLDYTIGSKYYYKGSLIDNNGVYAINQVATCSSEDVVGDGKLYDWEDANGNGDIDPTAAAVTLYPLNKDETNRTTDAAGLAYFTLQWAQRAALWQDAVMTFNATVGGTEGNKIYRIANLPAPADLFTDSSIEVPFHTSPYGVTPEQSPTGTAPKVAKQVYLTDPRTNTVVMDWQYPDRKAGFCTLN